MSVAEDRARSGLRAGSSSGEGTRRGSIREVCLVGRPPGHWSPGARVAWAGRPYRVVGDPSRQAHLRAEPA